MIQNLTKEKHLYTRKMYILFSVNRLANYPALFTVSLQKDNLTRARELDEKHVTSKSSIIEPVI